MDGREVVRRGEAGAILTQSKGLVSAPSGHNIVDVEEQSVTESVDVMVVYVANRNGEANASHPHASIDNIDTLCGRTVVAMTTAMPMTPTTAPALEVFGVGALITCRKCADAVDALEARHRESGQDTPAQQSRLGDQ